MRGARARAIATSFLVRSPLLPRTVGRAPTTPPSILAAAMSTSTPPNNRVRVVSYNLLSSKLARPSHFAHADPEHLEAGRRLPLLLEKLEGEMGRGFGPEDGDGDGTAPPPPPPPTVFALQEVCYPFASALHAFFANRGYHFVTGLYGRPFNGYMGVGLAYPLKDFETVKVDICRLSDERPGGWPREPIEEEGAGAKGIARAIRSFGKSFQTMAAQTLKTIIDNSITKRLGYSEEKKAIDPWEMSEKRFNVLLTAVLRFAGGSKSAFSISNYHMPCAFYAPPVMNIHAEMAARRAQDLAAESWKSTGGDGPEAAEGRVATMPHVLAGDFNILPDSPHYRLITTGTLDRSDPTYPPPKFGAEWTVGCAPMDSAYAIADEAGAEPEFTNYAHAGDDPDPFVGTLDYIFLSQRERTVATSDEGKEAGEWWKVHGVRKLRGKSESDGPFPNRKEPSDHYLISADLELVRIG